MPKKTEPTKDALYNKRYNKKRIPLFRVEVSTADSQEQMEEMLQMKDEIIHQSGNAKQGVIDMYRFAKKHGYFDN